jgi:N4-(beta-N-acetylglucosaminyl)-L-asparaginase
VKRIDFLKSAGLALAGGLTGWTGLKGATLLSDSNEPDAPSSDERNGKKARGPVMLGTWPFAQTAIGAAWDGLTQPEGTALDAVEAAARRTEADPNERSVGLGGRPDRDGIVTLDACVMDHLGNIGSVAAVENVVHVSSLARAVMEHTPHVMLVGDGARQFAREMGFPMEDLMVPDSKKEWEQWKIKSEYKPIPNIENHDTIGLLALDGAGRLAGLCTTSGMAFKMHGRVGDSPIIGAGLYVDGSVGGATATGHGEGAEASAARNLP